MNPTNIKPRIRFHPNFLSPNFLQPFAVYSLINLGITTIIAIFFGFWVATFAWVLLTAGVFYFFWGQTIELHGMYLLIRRPLKGTWIADLSNAIDLGFVKNTVNQMSFVPLGHTHTIFYHTSTNLQTDQGKALEIEAWDTYKLQEVFDYLSQVLPKKIHVTNYDRGFNGLTQRLNVNLSSQNQVQPVTPQTYPPSPRPFLSTPQQPRIQKPTTPPRQPFHPSLIPRVTINQIIPPKKQNLFSMVASAARWFTQPHPRPQPPISPPPQPSSQVLTTQPQPLTTLITSQPTQKFTTTPHYERKILPDYIPIIKPIVQSAPRPQKIEPEIMLSYNE